MINPYSGFRHNCRYVMSRIRLYASIKTIFSTKINIPFFSVHFPLFSVFFCFSRRDWCGVYRTRSRGEKRDFRSALLHCTSLILQSYFTILHWYFTGTSLILHWYFIGTSPYFTVLHLYFTHTSVILHATSCYFIGTSVVLQPYFTRTSKECEVNEVALFPPCSDHTFSKRIPCVIASIIICYMSIVRISHERVFLTYFVFRWFPEGEYGYFFRKKWRCSELVKTHGNQASFRCWFRIWY